MTTTIDLTDPELEARIRSLLRERAATVSGPIPELPHADPLLTPIGHRGNGRRWALAGVAAAACLVFVAAVVTLTAGDDSSTPDRVVATQPSVPAALGANRSMALFHADGTADAETVARDFLRVRLGDGTVESDAALRDGLVLEAGEPTANADGDLVPVTWSRSGDQGPAAGATNTVWVRPGQRGSDVVAATVEGMDLEGVQYDVGTLDGEIHAATPTDGYGRTTVATLTRRIAMPLIEPDAKARAEEGEPVASTVPIGEPFSIPMEVSGDLELAVRVTDGASGDVVGLAMRLLPAPSDPDMEGFEDMTPAEREARMREKVDEIPSASDSPACQEAGAFHMPELGGFPNEVPALPATPTDDVIAAGTGPNATPTAAIENLAAALDVSWEVGSLELASTDGAYATARLPGGRLVDIDLYRDGGSDAWRVVQVRTRGACRDFGGSGSSRNGVPEPKTTMGVPVVADAVGGQLWYRTDAGTQRVGIEPHDLGTHWVNVAAPHTKLTGQALVLRDDAGTAVLVDLTPETSMPG